MVMMILMGGLERKGEYNAKYFYFSFRDPEKKVGKYWLCLLVFFSFPPLFLQIRVSGLSLFSCHLRLSLFFIFFDL